MERMSSVRPAPTSPASPKNLAATKVERHIVRLRQAAKTIDRQQCLARRVRHAGIQFVDASPHHQRNDLRFGCSGKRPAGDRFAVAKHQVAVAHAADLFQKVADVDHAQTFLPQAADRLKQSFRRRPAPANWLARRRRSLCSGQRARGRFPQLAAFRRKADARASPAASRHAPTVRAPRGPSDGARRDRAHPTSSVPGPA